MEPTSHLRPCTSGPGRVKPPNDRLHQNKSLARLGAGHSLPLLDQTLVHPQRQLGRHRTLRGTQGVPVRTPLRTENRRPNGKLLEPPRKTVTQNQQVTLGQCRRWARSDRGQIVGIRSNGASLLTRLHFRVRKTGSQSPHHQSADQRSGPPNRESRHPGPALRSGSRRPRRKSPPRWTRGLLLEHELE